MVYGSCIIVANLVILMKFNNFTGYGEICVGLMIFAYFVFLGLESTTSLFPQVYGIFDDTFGSSIVWLGIMFAAAFSVAGEMVIRVW